MRKSPSVPRARLGESGTSADSSPTTPPRSAIACIAGTNSPSCSACCGCSRWTADQSTGSPARHLLVSTSSNAAKAGSAALFTVAFGTDGLMARSPWAARPLLLTLQNDGEVHALFLLGCTVVAQTTDLTRLAREGP